jgi:Lipopolysaccharide-assembly
MDSRNPNCSLRSQAFGFWLWIFGLWLLFASLGCVNYRMGARSLYAPDIQTVYVPMIESTSYRRYMGEWLTEAVVKRIEQVTPYKVVNTPEADSILTVRIITDTKQTLMESYTDEPREQQFTLQISASWVNRNGDQLGQPVNVPLPPSLNPINQSANLFPELGQSTSSAEMQDVQWLAVQVVSMMEAPW